MDQSYGTDYDEVYYRHWWWRSRQRILIRVIQSLDLGESPRILDFGCGEHKIDGAIGTDIRSLSGVDVVHDLSRPPYPFASDCTYEVHLNHVLEHMVDPISVLEEVWRVSKPGAKICIRVPHDSGPYAWRDPTHVRCFSTESFGYFGCNIYSYCTNAPHKL